MKVQSESDKAMKACRRQLARFADGLIGLDPERRKVEVASILTVAIPATIRMLTELLVGRLGHKDASVRVGAKETLIALGPAVLPALTAAITDRSEARLLGMASVLADIGRHLPVKDRVSLQLSLDVAALRAPTLESRLILMGASNCLRDPLADEPGTPAD